MNSSAGSPRPWANRHYIVAALFLVGIFLYASTTSAEMPTGSTPATSGPARSPSSPVSGPAHITSRVPVMQISPLGSLDDAGSAPPAGAQAVLYDQFDSPAPSAGNSQNFEPSLDAYDNQTADDFTVPGRQAWDISGVEVRGVYSGTGTASSVNVFFYQNSVIQPPVPASPIITETNIIPTAGQSTGNFYLPLPQPVRLLPGTYWVSVQANEDFITSGQWYWRDRAPSTNNPSAWRNPGNGYFPTGRCQDWQPNLCGSPDRLADQLFRLYGALSPINTPTGTPPTPTRTATHSAASATATHAQGTVTSTRTPGPPPSPVLTIQIPLGTGTPTESAPSPTPTSTPGECGTGWRTVSSPNGPSNTGRLYAVSVVSPDDVWAAGDDGGLTLTMHWDGNVWTIVPSPNPGTVSNYINGLKATGTGNVWAVGTWADNTSTFALMLRWDGVHWNQQAIPNVGSHAGLNGIAALSASDAWAVGESGSPTAHPVALHWDGSAWSQVPVPASQGDNINLNGVTMVARNDVWAVGSYLSQSIAYHWDGSSWQEWPTPYIPSTNTVLASVQGLASNDVWAVGGPTDTVPYILHWDGEQWSRVSTSVDDQPGRLYGLAAISPTDIWAVGVLHELDPLLLHWDGTAWSQVPPPDPGFGVVRYLYSVSALSAGDIWSVGQSNVLPDDHTVTIHYSDPCVNGTLTPTPGPGTPNTTSTAAGTPGGTTTVTQTPLPLPTSCLLQFTDVPVGSTFYPFVRCLACQGIINGYANGTFRPNNNVTRGQLSKIVANSAGFSDPQPSQLFEDVPVGWTFQLYIGRLASRGYINGYPCGGAGEPCLPPSNLPYFRPDANATRGQISKIDSNAAGFSDTPGGQQFLDVPPGSTYYTYTFRLVIRGVMGGYTCGGVGEPCVPPSNLPYFRPNANATRGQTSKIVSNTFFPECNPPAH